MVRVNAGLAVLTASNGRPVAHNVSLAVDDLSRLSDAELDAELCGAAGHDRSGRLNPVSSRTIPCHPRMKCRLRCRPRNRAAQIPPNFKVEAVVRIEHCVWCARSEGDYIEANKVTCGPCGDPKDVLNWVASKGHCDLDCVQWVDRDPGDRSGPYWNPPPDRCGGESNAAPPAYNPPFDRNGRTVKIPSYTSIGSSWSGNVPYVRSATATEQGGHIMLAVGFDDGLGCWIVKNSWGPTFGNAGFYLIAYGQCRIDSSDKLGLQFTNPDPWTKRRSHAGGMLESGDGALHRNFELIAPSAGNSWTHWWRDNSSSGLPWAKAETIGNDVADPPTFTATTYNRNFEMVYRTTGGRLHHRYFDQAAQKWDDGPIFGPTNANGAVGFIESSWGPGNFEVVVGIGGAQLQHWWRSGSEWQPSVTFGSNIATAGPSLIQSTWGALDWSRY